MPKVGKEGTDACAPARVSAGGKKGREVLRKRGTNPGSRAFEKKIRSQGKVIYHKAKQEKENLKEITTGPGEERGETRQKKKGHSQSRTQELRGRSFLRQAPEAVNARERWYQETSSTKTGRPKGSIICLGRPRFGM